MKFQQKLIQSIERKKSHVCVGLDSRYDRIPDFMKGEKTISQSILDFNIQVVEHTQELASAYKSNLAFYAGFGEEGLKGLQLTNDYIRKHYPEIPLLADCRRSEMGESVKMIEGEIFDWLHFDCVMVTPWFGNDTVKDYLVKENQGVCVYVHDSNPTAVEVQELVLSTGEKVYEKVTQLVRDTWNTNGNVFVEAGATYPTALKRVREIVGDDMVILTAGVGAQGGKVNDLSGIFGTNALRLLVNSSRGIIFAGLGAQTNEEYFAKVHESAKQLKEELFNLSQE